MSGKNKIPTQQHGNEKIHSLNVTYKELRNSEWKDKMCVCECQLIGWLDLSNHSASSNSLCFGVLPLLP
jgi:hypothetical protein